MNNDKKRIIEFEGAGSAAARARAGDKQAFCELYGQYKDRLYRYALYKMRDPDQAEDAVSETVLAAWTDISRLKNDDAFGQWIFAILCNKCNTMLKRMIRERGSLENLYEDPSDVHPGPSVMTELREALEQLNQEDQQIVLLSVVAGLNSREISEITGMKHATTRSRLSRSLAKMRDFLS